MTRFRCGFVGVATALIVAVGATCAQAAINHPFLFEISKFSSAPNVVEHLEGPCGIAVDSVANLYVSDYYHDQVVVFGSSGIYKTRIAGVDPSGGPCGLAVDAGGALYVNELHRRVLRFQPAAFPPTAGTAYGAASVVDPERSTGVAVDPGSGHLFVNHRTHVSVLEPSGEPVLVEGEPLRIGVGTLADGYGVAVSDFPATDGWVYVADAAENIVKAYDPATDLVQPAMTIEGLGTPRGGFASLRDAALAVDRATGHVFVTDNLQSEGFEHPAATVHEFNLAGEYRGRLPGPPELLASEPTGLALDNTAGGTQGRVYVTSGNSENASVYGFGKTAPGHRLEVSRSGTGTGAVSSEPAGIACPGACAAEYTEGAVVVLTASASPDSTFAGWSGGGCAGTGLCQVLMGEAHAVSAEFELTPPTASGSSHPTPASAVASAGATALPLSAAPASPPASRRCRVARRGRTRRARQALATALPALRQRSSRTRCPGR